jgi:Dyp-type peroxidase family
MIDITRSIVDPSDADFQPLLNDLQANILKGHGRKFAYHIFLQFQSDKIASARKWIAGFATSRITSAMKLEIGRQAKKNTGADGGAVFNLSLSASGYRALGFANTKLPQEQVTAGNQIVSDGPVFMTGAKGSATKLGDGDVQTAWEKAFRNNVDILIIVADSSADKAWQLSNNIVREVSEFSTVLLNQKGSVLHRKVAITESFSNAINIEHFGFADGISQPLYFKDEIEAQHSTTKWSDQEPLNLVLVPDPNGATGDSFGSFLVFRKLEQDVAAFMRTEKALPEVKDVDGILNKDTPGAMIVGRYRNGNVVVNSNGLTGHISRQSQLTNDFDYSEDPPVINDVATYSSKCPFFSHIRITNPRMDINANPKVPNPQGFVHGIRLTRRAIPYQDISRFGKGLEDLVEPTEEQLNKNRPSKGVGLLFMCYQAHIGKQFEFIQNNWANHGHIAGHNVGPDGIIGQTSPAPIGLPFKPDTPDPLNRKIPEQWGTDVPSGAADISFGNFVKNKGGEYFFTPSISFLRSLANDK